jgi:hypothetical protein
MAKSSELYQTTGYPETVIIGRDGIIRKKLIGASNWNSPGERGLSRGCWRKRQTRLTRILGIETSCDETSAAVLEGSGDDVVQRSLVILSQDVHRVFGGWFRRSRRARTSRASYPSSLVRWMMREPISQESMRSQSPTRRD